MTTGWMVGSIGSGADCFAYVHDVVDAEGVKMATGWVGGRMGGWADGRKGKWQG